MNRYGLAICMHVTWTQLGKTLTLFRWGVKAWSTMQVAQTSREELHLSKKFNRRIPERMIAFLIQLELQNCESQWPTGKVSCIWQFQRADVDLLQVHCCWWICLEKTSHLPWSLNLPRSIVNSWIRWRDLSANPGKSWNTSWFLSLIVQLLFGFCVISWSQMNNSLLSWICICCPCWSRKKSERCAIHNA